MDHAERERLRELIKSKQVKAAEITPERQIEIDRVLADLAAQIKLVQTGPNEFALTGRDVETGLRGGVPADLGNGIIFAGSMTKGVVMALPDEAFILSNCCNNDGSPIIVQQVGERSMRLDLWNKIRSMRMSGRRFYVFAHEVGLNAYLANLARMRARYQATH